MQANLFPSSKRGIAYPAGPQAGRSRVKAFTIVEVMVAAAVMVLTITSSFSVLGRSFGLLDTARCISYASQILQSEMERSRITGWGDGTAGAGSGTTGITGYSTTPVTIDIVSLGYAGANDLSKRMTLTRSTSDVHTGMILITLTIRWTSFDGRPLTRSYSTYYGKAGLYDYFAA